MTREKKARLGMAILGVLVGGISVGFFRVSLFGADPFQCFAAGMDNVLPFSFGAVYVILNAVLFVAMFLFGKRYIGVATFINLFLLGYVVEFSEATILSVVGDPSVAVRIVCLLIGIVVLCFASAVYFTADLGVSTYDAVSLMMADKGLAKFRYCRIFTDVTGVAIGYFLGAIVGIGTVVTAFFIGPLIDLYRTFIFIPFLARYKD